MTAQSWTMVGHDPSANADWAARPRYAPSDFVTLLWRERYLMVAVFAIIFVLGAVAAFTMKTSYPANASVLVRLGQETGPNQAPAQASSSPTAIK